ncbi:MAG: hypothetical protein IVW57_15320 [Ktedonobacterales bacterium]|nr:hypothetical protein [Ktedonobacterales bacterium]
MTQSCVAASIATALVPHGWVCRLGASGRSVKATGLPALELGPRHGLVFAEVRTHRPLSPSREIHLVVCATVLQRVPQARLGDIHRYLDVVHTHDLDGCLLLDPSADHIQCRVSALCLCEEQIPTLASTLLACACELLERHFPAIAAILTGALDPEAAAERFLRIPLDQATDEALDALEW